MVEVIELRVPRVARVVSFKIDAYIAEKLDAAATRYGFPSKSSFIRHVVCGVLRELGLLSDVDDEDYEYLCYMQAPPKLEAATRAVAAALKRQGVAACR